MLKKLGCCSYVVGTLERWLKLRLRHTNLLKRHAERAPAVPMCGSAVAPPEEEGEDVGPSHPEPVGAQLQNALACHQFGEQLVHLVESQWQGIVQPVEAYPGPIYRNSWFGLISRDGSQLARCTHFLCSQSCLFDDCKIQSMVVVFLRIHALGHRACPLAALFLHCEIDTGSELATCPLECALTCERLIFTHSVFTNIFPVSLIQRANISLLFFAVFRRVERDRERLSPLRRGHDGRLGGNPYTARVSRPANSRRVVVKLLQKRGV